MPSGLATLPSVHLQYCWLGLLTCKNRLPYNLYCVCGDVKHCTIQFTSFRYLNVCYITAVYQHPFQQLDLRLLQRCLMYSSSNIGCSHWSNRISTTEIMGRKFIRYKRDTAFIVFFLESTQCIYFSLDTNIFSTCHIIYVTAVFYQMFFSRFFYPRDAMLARVIVIATCLSVCLSVRLSRAGVVSKRRKLAARFLHHLVAPRL